MPCCTLHFRYRGLWGPFACSVQEEERKLWFKPSQLTSLLQHKFSLSVWFGAHDPCTSCLAAVSLSGSLHRVVSAFSTRSVTCLPDSTDMAGENGTHQQQQELDTPAPAFKAKVNCPNITPWLLFLTATPVQPLSRKKGHQTKKKSFSLDVRYFLNTIHYKLYDSRMYDKV